ncbi:cytochrome c-type biogenesis protein CcsB [Thermosulfidibacter takaii ABI70S6]|uniref:Cytochrome c-type biogenesis protein CcsB n=1 Tax=Thermosulfidibacter takaii (strain DSM 17441 / JCM 13301 / NBRC 103674 / ABI70S6) TaxID=1298851 RepID=A0A0S3QW47_THET7|nr:c-type cytochrome biogenesis protein CcsB [Thermosulfidibacter takaii]BAT72562.1 cytochrome c-type biogenesis protein CcsB [Thermosulfidibacter takaii ABI70S6]
MSAYKPLLILTLILYTFSTLHYLVFIVYQNERVEKLTKATFRAAVVFHLLSIVARWLQAGYFPVTSLHESLLFYSFLVALGYILLESRFKLPVVGAFLSPLNLIFLFAAITSIQQPKPLPPALQSPWLHIHGITSFAGEAAFTLSFIISIIYLLQEREIKRKKMGFFFKRLPPLNKLDEINYKILTIGFPFLTIGIITGAVWANTAWGSYWSWDPKETWSLITWLVYAGILHSRLTAGWRGRRAAILCIVGYLCVLFTFLGVNLLLPGLHSYSSM